jgi:sec-independent protein translocase protein TatB
MFGNFSMPELLIVGALALIVIGPKDLPGMMRSVGKFVGQARGMARQFQRSMDDAAREVDLAEFKEAKALMDKKADTKGLSDTLSKTVGLDDDEAEPPKKPAMSASEMAEASKDFSDEPKAEAPKPAPKTEPEVAKATPEPATASQG